MKNKIFIKVFDFTKNKLFLKNYLPKLDLADPKELFESVRRILAFESTGRVSGSLRLS